MVLDIDEKMNRYTLYNYETNKFCGFAILSKIIYDCNNKENRIGWKSKQYIEDILSRAKIKNSNIKPIKYSDFLKSNGFDYERNKLDNILMEIKNLEFIKDRNIEFKNCTPDNKDETPKRIRCQFKVNETIITIEFMFNNMSIKDKMFVEVEFSNILYTKMYDISKITGLSYVDMYGLELEYSKENILKILSEIFGKEIKDYTIKI